MKGQSVKQRRRHLLVVTGAFVQSHHTDACRSPRGKSIALERHFLRVHHRGKPRRHARRQALGHGQQHHAAVCLRQYALLRNRAPGVERGAQIKAAQQCGVADVQGDTPQRCGLRQQCAQQVQPLVTRGASR